MTKVRKIDLKNDRILRRPQVQEKTGLSRSTIYLYMNNDEKFPKPISLGKRSVGWLESEVDEWLIGKIQAAR